MKMESKVTHLFREHFHQAPAQVTHAPGRVNLIGDHTDYNDSFVLPAAINFGTYIAASARTDSIVNVVAADLSNDLYSFDLNDINHSAELLWVNYLKGSLKYLREKCPEIKGANIVISGNIPQGAGLSSSASLEIAIIHSFSQLFNLDTSGVEASLMAQKAENKFVGCNCGIMDHLISSLGKQDHAMLLDCQDLTYRFAPIPDNLSILVIDSSVKRGLVDSEYNLRREQCDNAAKILGKESLRFVTNKELSSNQSQLPPVLYKRAKHVVKEGERTIEAFDALKRNDVPKLSALMKASHLSLKNDFEVSTPEVDYLVDIIQTALGETGGARMTGGGFGGCVVCILPTHLIENVRALVLDKYYTKTGLTPSFIECTAVNGPFTVGNTEGTE